MKAEILTVALQINENFNSFTVFTTQKANGLVYDGFTPYTSIDEAINKAVEMTKVWNSQWMSTAMGYELITFKTNGTKEVEFIKTK